MGNNPVNYVDPDGRAAYSYKISPGKYTFSVDNNTLEDAAHSLWDALPIGGACLGTLFGYALGFQTIDQESGYEALMSATSSVVEIANNLDNSRKLINSLTKCLGPTKLTELLKDASAFSKYLGVVSRISSRISIGILVVNIFNKLLKPDEIAIDNLIYFLVGKCLTSTSHENVSALYVYAKVRIENMIADGDISYTRTPLGDIKSYCSDRDAVNQLTEELKVFRDILE